MLFRLPRFSAFVGVALACAGCGEHDEPLLLGTDPPIAVVWADSRFARQTGAGDLYVVQPDGTTAQLIHHWSNKELGDGPYGAFDALWSPRRDAVAISLAIWVGDPGSAVAVVTRDGGQLRSLTRGYDRRLLSRSPDGRELIHGAFYSGRRDVRSVGMEGGASKRLPFVVRNSRLGQFEWSPDGRRVVAQLYEGGLVTMDVSGKNLVHITRGDDSDPHWSPDGREILFTRLACDEQEIECEENVYVVGADGRDPRRLTEDPYTAGVGWSPDSRKILFLRGVVEEAKPPHEWVELWAMNADGSQETRLPFNRSGRSVVTADWGR